ncbi:MAG TPA: hypothetical protein VF331_16095 [Polyangiales bacterium]
MQLPVVQLPNRTAGIVLTLTWSRIANAHGYRVYRSPTAGSGASTMQLLGELSCAAGVCDCTANPTQCKLKDDGTMTTTAGKTPLPPGSVGVWHAVDGAVRCTTTDCKLGTSRESHSTVAVQKPTDPTKYYLYGFGGRDASGTYLDTYEVAAVTVDPATEAQTVADWAAGGSTLSSPRAELGVWVMDAENSSIIRKSGTPTDVWFLVGSGRTTGGTIDSSLQAGQLQANGTLGAFIATSSLKSALAGLGVGASNDQLYTFGGQSGLANGTSAHLCASNGNPAGCSGGIPALPNNAFNSLGSAATQRQYMGYTQVYLMRTRVTASGGGQSYGPDQETASKAGAYFALGADFFLGPGALLAELQLGYAGLNGFILRDTNAGNFGLALGDRLML